MYSQFIKTIYDNTPLEIIEIQTGSYLGEDDIIRLEDDYERNSLPHCTYLVYSQLQYR